MQGRRLLVRVVGAAVIVAATVVIGAPVGGAEPPGPTPPGLDHFKCYTSNTAVTTPIARGRTVKLQDQFGVVDVRVGKTPDRLCNPADKQHGANLFEVQNQAAHLVC